MLLQLAVVMSAMIQAECSFGISFKGPAAGESIVVARATGKGVSLQPPTDLLYRRVAGSEAPAYEFVVLEATRPDPMLEAWGLLAPRDTILAVPWAYDAACDPLVWTESEWVPPDSFVVFRADKARVHEGRRVIDVAGWHAPYPYGRLLRNEATPSPRGDVGEWLDPWEFWGILFHAPRPDSPLPRHEQLMRLENHYKGGPTYLLWKFPGPEILRRAREWANSG